jgi:hypothetical protein
LQQIVEVAMFGPTALNSKTLSLHANSQLKPSDGSELQTTAGLIALGGIMVRQSRLFCRKDGDLN